MCGHAEEAGAAEGSQDQAQQGVNKGLIVAATLLDKAPNLAGLTRSAEAFGAQALTVPDLKLTRTPLFESVSVTAQNWVDIQEVKALSQIEMLTLILQISRFDHKIIIRKLKMLRGNSWRSANRAMSPCGVPFFTLLMCAVCPNYILTHCCSYRA